MTSILLCSGVSTGTSTTVAQAQAGDARARPGARRGAKAFGVLGLLAIALVIGFPEQIVVLLDVEVARLELQGLLEGLARLGELALLLEGDARGR